MKMKKSKKKVSSGVKEKQIQNKPRNKQHWKKVKLSGNLLSDDGGASLEGLLGLEVLENYDKKSITKEKFVKVQKRNNNVKEKNSDESDSEHPRCSKNERKKKKKLKKKSNKNKTPENNEPGRFVRINANNDNPSDGDEDSQKSKKNGKKSPKKSKLQTNVNDESVNNSTSTDDFTVSFETYF